MPTRAADAVRADRADDGPRRACRPTRSATTRGRGQESRHNLTYWRYGDYAGSRPRRARPAARHAHGPPQEAGELPVGAGRNGHGIAEEAPLSASRSRRRGAGDGLAAERRHRRRRSRRPLRTARDRRLGAGRSAGRARAICTRDEGRIARRATGRLLLDTSSARSRRPSLFRWLRRRRLESEAGVAAQRGRSRLLAAAISRAMNL